MDKKFKFTNANIKNLPAPTKRTFVYDTIEVGLSLQITPNGAKSFYYRGVVLGKQIRVKLGEPSYMSVDDARQAARKAKINMKEGINPIEERKKITGESSLEQLYTRFMDEKEQHIRPITMEYYKDLWKRYLSTLANKKISQITPDELKLLHKRLTLNNGKAIGESNVFSGLQFNNVKFGTETSFFGRDFGLVGFLKNTEFGDLFWMTKSSFGEKFEMTNLNFTGAKRTEFLKCLEIFKNSLKRSSFDLYADEVNKYEELMRSKVSQPVINIHNMPIPEIPVKEGDYNLYTTEEAATILHVKQNTLERWRCERKGPKATKIGRKVFYKKCDLDEYINKYK